MIHVAFSLPDDVGATLADRARGKGFGDLAAYFRALAEAEIDGDREIDVSPAMVAALAEAEASEDSPRSFEQIIAEAKRKAGLRQG